MKIAQYFASFAVLTLALSAAAFAKDRDKDNHSGKFTLYEPTHVGSMELEPGQYKAEWTGAANDVKVDILQNGKTVATTQGAIKNLEQPAHYDAVTTKTLQDNSKALDEIDFSNRSEALVFGGE
jgi:hypothetical protein